MPKYRLADFRGEQDPYSPLLVQTIRYLSTYITHNSIDTSLLNCQINARALPAMLPPVTMRIEY